MAPQGPSTTHHKVKAGVMLRDLNTTFHGIAQKLSFKPRKIDTTNSSPAATPDPAVQSEAPTLAIDPTSLEDLNITFPTDRPRFWEPYDLTAEHPPTEENHPIYHEMPRWRRHSLDQHHTTVAMILERNRLRGFLSELTIERDALKAELDDCKDEVAEKQKEVNRHINVNRRPVRKLVGKLFDLHSENAALKEVLFWIEEQLKAQDALEQGARQECERLREREERVLRQRARTEKWCAELLVELEKVRAEKKCCGGCASLVDAIFG